MLADQLESLNYSYNANEVIFNHFFSELGFLFLNSRFKVVFTEIAVSPT